MHCHIVIHRQCPVFRVFFCFQLCSVSSAASPHLTPSSSMACPRAIPALALWCLSPCTFSCSPRKAEAMAIFFNFWDRYVTIGWVKETVKIEGQGSVDSTLQRLTPPRNSYIYITCRMSRVMCSMINVKYIYMTQFEIECRFGGHSVTKKFKTIWQILLAKPKLWKNLNFYK